MATITQENIGLLHDQITVKLEKADYYPAFEKSLKEYSKKANIPGFRKGMVPSGLIKKMYGPSLLTDEILKTADRELIRHLEQENLDIFAQPLPLESDFKTPDVNNTADYTFRFEIGMKPAISLPEPGAATITRYKVPVTDEMIDAELSRLQNRYGTMKDEEEISSDENVLNVVFAETDASGNSKEDALKKENSLLVKFFSEDFRKNWMGKKRGDILVTTLDAALDDKEKEWIISDLGFQDDPQAGQRSFSIEIGRIGLLEKRELNAEFFDQLYPGQGIDSLEAFRNKTKDTIEAYWNSQAINQIHDQIFHYLTENTSIQFPEAFLKRWMKTQEEAKEEKKAPKTEEEENHDFAFFLKQLKWTLISDKLVQEQDIKVTPDEMKGFARQQLFSYMGNAPMTEDQGWVNDYVEKMMRDRKWLEDTYQRIKTQKIFDWAALQVQPTDQEISDEEFTKLIEEHQHHHH